MTAVDLQSIVPYIVGTLQGYIYRLIPKTSDASLNGLMSTLVSVLFPVLLYAIMNGGKKWVELIIAFFGAGRHNAKNNSLIIENDCVDLGYYGNDDYDAISWYISQNHTFTSGVALAKRVRKSKYIKNGVFLPAANEPIIFRDPTKEYDIIVKVGLLKKEDGSEKSKWYELSTHHPFCLAEVIHFLKTVREKHDQYIDKCAWVQKFYRINNKAFEKDSSNTIWSDQLTHNTKSFANVVLDREQKDYIVNDLHSFLASEKWYGDRGISYKRGYMLYGEPGTGKTSIVAAIANTAKYDIYSLDLSKITNDSNLERAFDAMPDRCVVLMEDIDCMCPAVHSRVNQEIEKTPKEKNVKNVSSPSSSSKYNTEISLSALLNLLDGVSSNHGRIFVMTTNYLQTLDDALVRPGRIDARIKLGKCSAQQIVSFFDIYFSPDAVSDDKVFMKNITTHTNDENNGEYKEIDEDKEREQDQNDCGNSSTSSIADISQCRDFLVSNLTGLMNDADGPTPCVLSPAQVSCIMQHHKNSPWRAAQEIVDEAKKAIDLAASASTSPSSP